jgi:2-polyprenyl-3-methyl-5-hydroxy-6-metoxy-1,4-benzoquinol methylase
MQAPPLRLERVPCPLCGQDRPRPYRAGMYRIGEQRFDLVRCPCGLVYVNPRPDPATVEWMYADPAYYTAGYNLGVETENYFTRRAELVAQYEAEARTLAREIGGTGRLFEIGAAGGFFLEGARRAGFGVRGAELSSSAVEYARRELALDVFDGPFEAAGIEPASQDVIVADNVLEHAPDPRALVRSVRGALREGGHFLVIVPSYVNSPYFRWLDRARRLVPRGLFGAQLERILKIEGEGEQGHPYHLLEFDRRTLGRMLAEEGFELVRCDGSVPLPAHLFKRERPSLRERALRCVFRSLDSSMRAGLLPGARERLLVRKV